MNFIEITSSSNIAAFAYDVAARKLAIRFVNNPDVTYMYFDVPEDVVSAFISNESMGRYFCQHIKSHYDWMKLQNIASNESE